MKFLLITLSALLSAVVSGTRHCGEQCLIEAVNPLMDKYMGDKANFLAQLNDEVKAINRTKLGYHECVDGYAAGYPCKGVDLLGFIPSTDFGVYEQELGNDIWGWTDPETGREYALSGQGNLTAIVDVTGGEMVPVVNIKRSLSIWSDIKVYKNHMYVGTEGSRAEPGHGIQVFDLTRIRGITGEDGIVNMYPDLVYIEGIKQSHNVVINEETGFMYIVGSRSTCAGGLHIVDIRSPGQPKFVGCFSDDGYTHDAQCVVYKGPHEKYQGREICFNYNENSLLILDVEDKDDIQVLSNTSYEGFKYTHQGWATDDHQFLLLNDELDEVYKTSYTEDNTHTYIWDIRNLEDPKHFSNFESELKSIDHNLYIKGKKAYLSNYSAGLRILDLTDIANGNLKETAYFDVYPENNMAIIPSDDPDARPQGNYVGSWSSYVYFKSGNIAVNSIDRGLFLVKPHEPNHC